MTRTIVISLKPRGSGISNVQIIQRAAHNHGSVGECGYDGHISRRPGGLFDFRRAGCEGQTGDAGRGSANSRQRRPIAYSAKGRSLLVARLAELRTALPIRYETALGRHADSQDYRSPLNSNGACTTPACLLAKGKRTTSTFL